MGFWKSVGNAANKAFDTLNEKSKMLDQKADGYIEDYETWSVDDLLNESVLLESMLTQVPRNRGYEPLDTARKLISMEECLARQKAVKRLLDRRGNR